MQYEPTHIEKLGTFDYFVQYSRHRHLLPPHPHDSQWPDD